MLDRWGSKSTVGKRCESQTRRPQYIRGANIEEVEEFTYLVGEKNETGKNVTSRLKKGGGTCLFSNSF